MLALKVSQLCHESLGAIFQFRVGMPETRFDIAESGSKGRVCRRCGSEDDTCDRLIMFRSAQKQPVFLRSPRMRERFG